MRLLNTLARIGQRLRGSYRLDDAHSTANRVRICRFEQVELRNMMTASVPQIIVGGTEYEQAAGNDSQPNVFVVTFEGGAAGTQLTQLQINGSKSGGALTFNDAIFDTAPGGLGAYESHALQVVSHDGFQVTGTSVNDGSTLLTMDFSGFTAGMKLVFTIDVDQVIFIDSSTGEVDVDAVDEGAEFQRSQLVTSFTAPTFQAATVSALYWDVFGPNISAAEQTAGNTLDLPNDAYTNAAAESSMTQADGSNYTPPTDDVSDLTAGAVGLLQQVPLPITMSGTVYEDHNLNDQQDSGDEGVAGVKLELWELDGTSYVDTGVSTTTDASGNYTFTGILPGTYQVVKTNPPNYFSVGANPGEVGGTTDGSVVSADILDQITLVGGDNSQHNNFAIAKPATLAGYVYYDANDDGQRETGETGIGGVTLSLVPVHVVGTAPAPIQVVTAADGSYSVSGLNPGVWKVVEVTQPAGYLDGLDRAGTAGGVAVNPGDEIDAISLSSGQSGQEYDFGKLLPNSVAGRVLVSDTLVCTDDPNPTPLAGVTLQLLNSSNQVVGTTTTDQNGNYSFTGLPAGTYSVQETPPAGYIEGCDTVGSVGGQKPTNLLLSQIVLVTNTNGINYNFYEHPYSSLSGNVYLDANDDHLNSTSDPVLAGVTVQLLDSTGQVLQTTQTNAAGNYTFSQLTPGTYSVRELQPNGYYYEDAVPGSVGGTASDDHDLTQVVLPMAANATNYNFWLLPPAKLSGDVFVDTAGDHLNSTSDPTLAGVTIELLNSGGQVVGTAQTTSGGSYSFSPVAPGTYTLEELQPAGYFYEDAVPGSVGGTATDSHDLGQITVPAGVNGVNYNFWVLPPGSISGRVHNDVDGQCETNPNEPGLAGVTVQLLNQDGVVLQTAVTDSNGAYSFRGLLPGTYRVHTIQPTGYLAEDSDPGSVGGESDDANTIGDIELGGGINAVNYNFCEVQPASLTGRVMINITGLDCNDTWTLPGVPNVTVNLLNASNQIIATTVTDANGDYAFNNLMPGQYNVQEIVPKNYFAEAATPGDAGGTAIDDTDIVGATLAHGQASMCYDFYIVPPASLTGRVMVNITGLDCDESWTLPGVANVTVNLLNANNQIVATTVTDADGDYAFNNLVPGQYSLQELPPTSYFAEAATPGDAGGTTADAEDIVGLTLTPGQAAMCYDFYVMPPATISGTVFQDGPPIQVVPGQAVDVPANRTGVLAAGDPRIAGVTLELVNGVTGAPIVGSQALPGFYNSNGPITTVTDANGNYAFNGLAGGNYAVIEIEPQGNGYIDGITTAGSTGGVVVGPYTQTSAAVLAGLTVPVPHDAILQVVITAGETSKSNNFSVVQTQLIYLIQPLPAAPPPAAFANLYSQYFPLGIAVPQPPVFEPPSVYSGSSQILDYSWHLSVVNAGQPRGPGDPTLVQLTAAQAEELAWQAGMEDSEWTLAGRATGRNADAARRLLFGMRGGIPVSGDFNGDGISDVGVFRDGQWFIDVNGNGVWDEGDLWAKLGYNGDKPVVGDWDGDGKDDIGIFGRAWAGDPRHIAREPGLPDSSNKHYGTHKNVPPPQQQATIGKRALKLTSQGTTRADLIDHVFHYGTPRDIPLVGDWNGDGTDTIAVFRDGWWYLDIDGDGKWTDQGDNKKQFGQSGDIPVAGDFNGDGVDELAVFRQGTWYIDTNGNGQIDAQDQVVDLGQAGDIPVVGDWDGDGHEEIGTYRDGEIAKATARK